MQFFADGTGVTQTQLHGAGEMTFDFNWALDGDLLAMRGQITAETWEGSESQIFTLAFISDTRLSYPSQ